MTRTAADVQALVDAHEVSEVSNWRGLVWLSCRCGEWAVGPITASVAYAGHGKHLGKALVAALEEGR